jgi:hypothetical protein
VSACNGASASVASCLLQHEHKAAVFCDAASVARVVCPPLLPSQDCHARAQCFCAFDICTGQVACSVECSGSSKSAYEGAVAVSSHATGGGDDCNTGVSEQEHLLLLRPAEAAASRADHEPA